MTLHLVRHPPVAAARAGLCYGWSDVEAATAHSARDLIRALASLRPDWIVSSDLRRCAALAEALADTGAAVRLDPRWRERGFGDWELRAWDDIHAEDPAAIDRLMRPDFAPPGGESLIDLDRRVAAALAATPAGRGLIIAHGGPIAMARARLLGLKPGHAVSLIPAPGEIVAVVR